MNLDQLRAVQARERKKDGLQELRPTFYRNVAEYLSDLEAERTERAATAKDPFSSPEVSQLTDEIETAREIVEAIYERRMGKIVKQASLAAAGLDADDDGLSQEEAELFADLVDRIEANKDRVIGVLEGAEGDVEVASAPSVDSNGSETESEPPPPTPADTDETPNQVPTNSESEPLDRLRIRITQSVGAIIGIDEREYDLQPDDIVRLPEANAQPLLDRSAAELLE
ncbi:MAG: hypothetical protein U5K37_03285 [Natrialbaceae archaeon]|nr:hypothetical protein [Natrialbaceae archaeon]